MQEVHAYLAASESLIRTEGLTKPVKSQKISKLHHIFSFLRIIHESTTLLERIYQGGSGCGQAQNNATQDNHHTSGSRLAWVEEEEPEDSEEDSLFVSIYQMPTTLLSLLSQTSSLYKQLHSPEGISATFGRRCQIIETRIFNWRAPKGLAFPNYDEAGESKTSATLSRDIAAHLVSATHYALIVHFQRQIRNTNPRLLQHYVTAAIDHLLVHEQLKKSNQISSAPFPWPGFIVGCEAYDIASREKMNIYLSTVRSYNLGSLLKSEKVVYEVWKRQDSSRSDGHWEDVLRDWDMQLVLT
jgi:arginine metabolism regulation protein II